jgi:hypothetical protein
MRIGSALFCFAILLTNSGCIFDPHKDPKIGPPPPPVYPALSDPYNVMAAYKTAYEHRDSVEIKALYDDGYIGQLTDNANPSNNATFNKSNEVQSVAAMARSHTIVSVQLTLPPALTRYTDLADPPGWATINLPPTSVTLQIDDTPDSYQINPANETFVFKFVPTTPVSTSPTDTTWKIIRWTETAN